MAQETTAPGVNLARLLEDVAAAPGDVFVSDITLDSRRAVAAGAFLACRGISSHGLQYVQAAVAAGVRAVLWEPAAGIRAPRLPVGVLSLPVPGLGRHLGRIADRFFASPSRHVRIAGITGTNGKTTTAWLLAQALEHAGLRAAYGGTLGWGRPRGEPGGRLDSATHTTPDCIEAHRRISDLHAAGARALAMEVSSHALAQDRIAAVRFDTAVFTNLSRDHLDYHADMQAYGEAKARLFGLSGLQHRVVNVGDAWGRRLAGRLPVEAALTAVWSGAADRGPQDSALQDMATEGFVHAGAVMASSDGLQVRFDSSWGGGCIRSRLIGDFNADNLMTALAVLLLWEVPLSRAVQALEQAVAPPGRMETFGGGGQPLVVVDYAHSPDALAKVLRGLRRHARGRLWCVFGCGGDRDAGKRPIMGALAAELADEIVLTDDNPRTEDPQLIIEQIAAGIPADRARRAAVHTLPDRAAAIELAVRSAAPGDVVLVAGKGHEEYQIHGARAQPFSDRAVVRGLLGGVP
jgi:UDP-N-acetylmuramoyl-L-alanyl-D-glutamate--2,6-diaminopimelate ligase